MPDAAPSAARVDGVILAGGAGTRLGGHDGPKPLAEIGGRPLVGHVLAQFAAAGFERVVVALGCGAPLIRRWFAEHDLQSELPLEVALVDTGTETGTAGRVARLGPQLSSTFLVANVDGLSTIDLDDMLAFHADHGRQATVAAVRPAPRFGYLTIDEARRVTAFAEKSPVDAGWINGGYWVLDRAALEGVADDDAGLSVDLAPRLAADGELMAYLHDGFWECVDTAHDLEVLQARWDRADAPWRVD